MNQLMQWIVSFQRRTFGVFGFNATEASIAKLKEEVQELESSPTDLMEYADCFILLLAAAGQYGYKWEEIEQAIIGKMHINEQRKWERKEDGTYQHKS